MISTIQKNEAACQCRHQNHSAIGAGKLHAHGFGIRVDANAIQTVMTPRGRVALCAACRKSCWSSRTMSHAGYGFVAGQAVR